ncbi:MAG: LuxR C-terminal-related transcriptional regulator [Rhodomicrobiaceae bacterium]
MKSFQIYKNEINNKKSMKDVKAYFSQQIASHGYIAFDAFSYQTNTLKNLRQDGNYYVASYGLEYIEKFVDQGMIENCPVTKLISKSSFPFDYIEALEKNKSNWVTQFQYRLMKLFNVHHAWLIPFNTIEKVRGVTLYTQGQNETTYQNFINSKEEVQLMASSFMQALEKFEPSMTMAKSLTNKSWNNTTLSTRETECLKHCCEGLTYAEIGKALNVTENTIRFHMKNIFRKLKVNTRSEAVAISKYHY